MEKIELASSRSRLKLISSSLGPHAAGIEETLDLTAKHPDMAAARAGKALESLLHTVFKREHSREAPRDHTLEDLQRDLSNELGDDVKIHLQTVQRFRNHGAHHRKTALKPTDVLTVLSSLLAIAEWFAAAYPVEGARSAPTVSEPHQENESDRVPRSPFANRADLRALTTTGERCIPTAQISEAGLLIRIPRLFNEQMTDEALYEATRGIWRIGSRRSGATYAFSVARGIIREVYVIDEWFPAGTTPYATRTFAPSETKGRHEFLGRLAPNTIRDKYLGQSVAHYFPKGAQTAFMYVNC